LKNDTCDLALIDHESQGFCSENEIENETNSSQNTLSNKEDEKSQLQLHVGLEFNTWKEV
ncbi:26713_t:CDS:2, partial [Gigaspora margarita]